MDIQEEEENCKKKNSIEGQAGREEIINMQEGDGEIKRDGG